MKVDIFNLGGSAIRHSVLSFQAGMKSKVKVVPRATSAKASKDGQNQIGVLGKEILGLKTKCESLSKENLQLKVEKRMSEEETRRVMDDSKSIRKQLEASRVDQEKKSDCDDCGNKAEKITKLEKENHDLKQHNWHLKMVKLPHYVKLLHKKDEEIAELDSRNQGATPKNCDENLLQEKEKDRPEEITLDEEDDDDDDDICEINIVPVPQIPFVVNVDLAEKPDDKSEIMLISQNKTSSEGNTSRIEKDRKQSEKTQFNEIIDSMMQTSDGSAIKEEERSPVLAPKRSDHENMIDDLMLNLSQKAKANEEAKKMSKKADNAKLDQDTSNSALERESVGKRENIERESEGNKSAKRKRKLFNSFCDDLMDEQGEIHPQVKVEQLYLKP